MTFNKTQEIIEKYSNYGGFLLLRKLNPSYDISALSDKQLIADIIPSKFHHWQGEQDVDGLTVNMSSKDHHGKLHDGVLTNHKFYGFFDNSKINPEHYTQLSFEKFFSDLMTAIKIETINDLAFIQRAKNVVDQNLNNSSIYYHLDLDKEINVDLVAEWQVYDFFYDFISIDRINNLITLIEFGLD